MSLPVATYLLAALVGPGYPVAPAAQTRPRSNPLRFVRTLDQHLTLPAEITLFGHSALALGIPQRQRISPIRRT